MCQLTKKNFLAFEAIFLKIVSFFQNPVLYMLKGANLSLLSR